MKMNREWGEVEGSLVELGEKRMRIIQLSCLHRKT